MRGQTLLGSTLDDGRYQQDGSFDDQALVFQDVASDLWMGISKDALARHLLLLGGSGSGKTNILSQVVEQLLVSGASRSNDAVLIFDTKGDYISHPGFLHDKDIIIGNGKQYRASSAVWNIFGEVLADGNDPIDYEANAREIASVLFKDRGSQSQPFFSNAARDIFSSTLIYFVRRRADRPDAWGGMLDNKHLVSFLMRNTPDQLMQYFSRYPDLRGLRSYVGDGKNNQALGVLGELRSMIFDCFQGVFAASPTDGRSSFSMRKEVNDKRGQVIFVEYDLSIGESMTPIYRLLVDLALKQALSEHDNPIGSVYVILDELKLLPKLEHLEDAINYGRSKHVTVIAGTQSINQIYSIYGHEQGQTILGGFGSLIALHTSDYESRDYVTKLFGSNVTSYRYRNENGDPIDRERDGWTVEEWDQRMLLRGQAIVGLASQTEPFLFQFGRDPSADKEGMLNGVC